MTKNEFEQNKLVVKRKLITPPPHPSQVETTQSQFILKGVEQNVIFVKMLTLSSVLCY